MVTIEPTCQDTTSVHERTRDALKCWSDGGMQMIQQRMSDKDVRKSSEDDYVDAKNRDCRADGRA